MLNFDCTNHVVFLIFNIKRQHRCSVKHLEVQTKAELYDALVTSQPEEMDCVIEVVSSIEANATFHRWFSFLTDNTIFFFFLRYLWIFLS